MDTGVPKGSFSMINLCQLLYATTSGPKIGAHDLIRQLGYEQSLQCLDPDHLPFLDDKNLARSITDCSFQLPPSHAVSLAEEKLALRVWGTNSQPQKIPCWCRANCLLVNMCHFLCAGERSLCCWHMCDGTCSPIPPGKPSCHSNRQTPQHCQALSWRDSWAGKGHAREKGRFPGPCLSPCPLRQGWEQSACHVPRLLLIQP